LKFQKYTSYSHHFLALFGECFDVSFSSLSTDFGFDCFGSADFGDFLALIGRSVDLIPSLLMKYPSFSSCLSSP
jgi:hypothetical protein